MAICRFCEQNKKLTKEHVWSSSVLRLFDNVAPYTIDEARGVVHTNDPMVKDLCGDCNHAMSPVDTAMAKFAKDNLIGYLDRRIIIDFHELNLVRWVMKTASNHERALKINSQWWRQYISFFMGKNADISLVDVLLGPWRDVSPDYVASEALGVPTLGARGLLLAGLRKVDYKAAHSQLYSAWALKVGSGVFLLLVWKPSVSDAVRSAVINELWRFRWLRHGQDNVVGHAPFNELTCPLYHIPFDPLESDPFDVISQRRMPGMTSISQDAKLFGDEL